MEKLNTVMLIDDMEADNYINRLMIESMNIAERVVDFEYAEKALEYLNSEDRPGVDVIFLDINMPRMDGFEFLDEYKNLDPQLKSKVVVIMLTTSMAQYDRERAKTYADLDDFQNKPLSRDSLREMLNKHFSWELH
ncbi:MAG: response regulator [Pseudomonadota bacterium]